MEREKLLIKFCDFLTHVMGPETEVVLHDKEGFIIWIAQGHITGRAVGQQDLLPAMELVARQRALEGFDYTTGYKSFSRKGTPLRSSSLFFRDDEGKLDYVLCVNQDISAYVNLQQMLDAFIGDRPAGHPGRRGDENDPGRDRPHEARRHRQQGGQAAAHRPP